MGCNSQVMIRHAALVFFKVETTVTGVGTMAPAGTIVRKICRDTATSTTFSFGDLPDVVHSSLRRARHAKSESSDDTPPQQRTCRYFAACACARSFRCPTFVPAAAPIPLKCSIYCTVTGAVAAATAPMIAKTWAAAFATSAGARPRDRTLRCLSGRFGGLGNSYAAGDGGVGQTRKRGTCGIVCFHRVGWPGLSVDYSCYVDLHRDA